MEKIGKIGNSSNVDKCFGFSWQGNKKRGDVKLLLLLKKSTPRSDWIVISDIRQYRHTEMRTEIVILISIFLQVLYEYLCTFVRGSAIFGLCKGI